MVKPVAFTTYGYFEMGHSQEGKKIDKLEYFALCSSLNCRKAPRGERKGSQDGVIKDVPKDSTECPDCGHMLFWKTRRAKQPFREMSYEEKERRKLKRKENEEKAIREGKVLKKKGRPRGSRNTETKGN